MNVLVDTSIWSLALRHKSHNIKKREIEELENLIRENRASIIGPVRQELLSGISDDLFFRKLKQKLHSFSDIPLEKEHYELAAEMYNQCRKKGIQGSHVDFMICAIARTYQLPIFTHDLDFHSYSKILKLTLYQL